MRTSTAVLGDGALLTATRPFEGPSLHDLIAQRELEPPRVRSRNRRAPKQLAFVCEQALRRDPAERHRNAGEFALALDDALTDSG